MTDVCTKAITGNAVTNGRAVVGVTKLGRYDSNAPVSGIPFTEQNAPSPSGLVAKYDARFDDPTYYG